MKVVDANILLYTVNSQADQHALIRAWWEDALSGDESIGLPWAVINAFLRLSTNQRVFPNPLPVDTAVARVDAWLCAPPATIVTEKPSHWTILRALLAEAGTAGNLTSDAHLATIAITYDASLVSCDADFARFQGLRWENPLR